MWPKTLATGQGALGVDFSYRALQHSLVSSISDRANRKRPDSAEYATSKIVHKLKGQNLMLQMHTDSARSTDSVLVCNFLAKKSHLSLDFCSNFGSSVSSKAGTHGGAGGGGERGGGGGGGSRGGKSQRRKDDGDGYPHGG